MVGFAPHATTAQVNAATSLGTSKPYTSPRGTYRALCVTRAFPQHSTGSGTTRANTGSTFARPKLSRWSETPETNFKPRYLGLRCN